MKKKTNKIISLILAAALAVSSLTFVSFADEADVTDGAVLDEAVSDAAVEAEDNEAVVLSSVETEEVVEADLEPYYSSVPFSYTDDFSKMNQEYNMTQYINLAHTDAVNGNSTTKIELQNKAVYATLEDAVSGTGTATFTADMYSNDVDGDYAGRAFRIYLENAQTNTTNGVGDAAFDSSNIFYHLTDIGSTVYVVTDDTPSVSAAGSGMTALGAFETDTWYRFVIEVDFDNSQTTTYMYKHSSDGTYNDNLDSMTLIGSLTTSTVTGKTVSLKQIRLVRTAKTYVYYDNVSLSYDSTENETNETTTETTTESGGSGDSGDDEEAGSSFLWWFDEVNNGGTVSPGDYTAGNGAADITVVPGLNGESYSAQSGATLEYSDGTTHSGYWASNRPDSAGSLTTLPTSGSSYYFKLNTAGTVTVYNYVPSGKNFFVKDFDESLTLVNTTTTGSMDSNGNDSLTFAGEAGHTYLVTTGGTNGLRFYGFKFLVDQPTEVPVNVTAGEGVDFSKATISFTDVDTEAVYATVVDGQTSVTLNAGHTYEVSIDDGGIAVDYNGETEFTFTGSETSIDLTLTNVPDTTLTGTITSADSDNAASVVTSITFTKMSDSSVSYTTTDIDAAAGTYTAVLKPGEYNTSVVTTDGSTTADRVSVSADGDNVNEIYLEKAETTGTYDLPTEVTNSSSLLTFSSGISYNNSQSISCSSGSTITVPVEGVQKVTVSGWYAGTWDINGQGSVTTDSSANAANPTTTSYTTDGTETSVTVNITGDGANYLYWITVEDAGSVAFKSELSVPGDYDTLNEAIDAINSMDRPEGEDGRVTITLTSDLQEQVYMDADYVTLDGQGQYEVTWYYGVGSAYYSIDSNGLYSETLFRDAYSQREASGSLWGGVMLVYGDYFLAHDVTFRNTYNYEVTDKEIADGVTPTDGKKERTKGTDVTVSSMRERSNALYTYGNYCEYKNCNILSSQDTLGINGTLSNYTYFKDCVIGGNCDYICGAGTMLFDNCTLQWKTEGASSLGYITAPKSKPYIFRNCTITQDGANYVADSTGFYGRPWDAAAYAIYYQCETNDLIRYDGWYDMSSNSADNAYFYEYNNLKSDGSVFMSTRGKDLNDEQYADILAAVEGDAVIDGMLGGWTPVYYESLDEPVGFGSSERELSENTYDIDVALLEADAETASAVAEIIESATLTVNEDGTAVLTVNLSSTSAGLYASGWKVYTDSEENAAEATIEATDENGNPTQISFTIADNNVDGAYVSFSIGGTAVAAYLAIDYTTATIAGEDSGNGLRGDIDQNGVITANDAACLLAYVLNDEVKVEGGNYSAAIADVAGSVYGEIAAEDAALIMDKVLNGATQFKDLNGGSSSGGSGSEVTTYEEATETTTEAAAETTTEAAAETTTEAAAETTTEAAAEGTTEAAVVADASYPDTDNNSYTVNADGSVSIITAGDGTAANVQYAVSGAESGVVTITGSISVSTVSGACTYVQVLGTSGSEIVGIRSASGNALALRLNGTDVIDASPATTWADGAEYDYTITIDLTTGYATLAMSGDDGSTATAASTSTSLVGQTVTGVKIASKGSTAATIVASKPEVTLSASTGETGGSGESGDSGEEEETTTISVISSEYSITASDFVLTGSDYYGIFGTFEDKSSYIRIDKNNGIILNLNEGATITVSAKSANSSDATRQVVIYSGQDKTTQVLAQAVETADYGDVSYTTTAAGYYLIAADNGINVKSITITY